MISVTAGAGFTGANLVKPRVRRGRVTAFDWFGKDAKWKSLRHCAADRFILPEHLADFRVGQTHNYLGAETQ
jgi:hypothetical protein